MDQINPQNQEKMAALVRDIEKHLMAGAEPKKLYEHLVKKEMLPATAKQLVNQAIANLRNEPPPAPPAVDSIQAAPPAELKSDGREKIKAYIKTKLDAGVEKRAILDDLIAHKVPRLEAIKLIEETDQPAVEKPVVVPASPDFKVEEGAVADMPALVPVSVRGVSQWIVDHVNRQLMDGMKKEEIVSTLVEEGMERNQAIDVVLTVDEKLQAALAPPEEEKGGTRASGRKKMLIGAAFFFGGSCITLISWLLADEGGTYWLFYGPIIYGFVYGVWGVIEWSRN